MVQSMKPKAAATARESNCTRVTVVLVHRGGVVVSFKRVLSDLAWYRMLGFCTLTATYKGKGRARARGVT